MSEINPEATRWREKALYVTRCVVFVVLPLAFLLSVALGWNLVRGSALASAFVLASYFVAFVMQTEVLGDGNDADDGDGGEPDEDEIPLPDGAHLLLEVKQPPRDEWRN
jgi:hypothetical protein